MEIEADLHLHSHHSDGVLSPSLLVEQAARLGLKAIALTDHDSVDGVREAREAAPAGLEVVPGAELSASYRGRDIHLLAYDLDPGDAGLRAFLEPLRHERRSRAERIVARLNDAGVPVTMAEVEAIAGAAGTRAATSIGRPHIADAIVRHGAAADLDDAFARWLRRGQPGYVPRRTLTVAEAIGMVRSHGGAIVVAHPSLNLPDSDVEALALEGLDGIEVFHPKQNDDQRRRLAEIARRLGLPASGGSDFHGPGRSRHALGAAGVGLEALRRLRERARGA
ncbi:MAG TPA: PHP domain-containing protein [Candidatus Polarisedimenticolia bacterium]|nr:PHP domain-containing protein [Candidatus Polarisedimenticolia bacterium]